MLILTERMKSNNGFSGPCKAQISLTTEEEIQKYTYLSILIYVYLTHSDWQAMSLKKTRIVVLTQTISPIASWVVVIKFANYSSQLKELTCIVFSKKV